MVDELRCRRSDFLDGLKIRMADDQEWVFPVPASESPLRDEFDSNECRGLIQAILESERSSDQRLAELALAIHTLLLNYHLRPTDLEALFTFTPGSATLAESQTAFSTLARECVAAVSHAKVPDFSPEMWAGENGLFSSLRRAFRSIVTTFPWRLASRKSETVS